MVSYAIFVIDDEPLIRTGIAEALAGEYAVTGFSTAEAALAAMEKDPPDLVLLDIGLPGMDGVAALSAIKASLPEMLVIMITAYEDPGTVVAAMKAGAHDYIVKPIHMDALETVLEKALSTIKLTKKVRALQRTYLKENVPCFIGESDEIHDVMDFIEKVAKSPDTPIFILGDTGTGKELLAGAIHYLSPNFKGPLVTMNCAAIPAELIESELFGYGKGAFSGARQTGKKGLIQEAAGGTLFLDEVGDLSLTAQAKLLRFLESGEFYRVGETRPVTVQTRVISATNKDIDALIEKGLFRKDLYFRLGVIRMQVPSLNERRADILPLASHFLVVFNKKFNKKFNGFSPNTVQGLMAHDWKGNVRELKNLVERGVLVGDGPELCARDLGIEGQNSLPAPPDGSLFFPPIPPEGVDLAAIQKSVEKHYIQTALEMAGGNECQAARILGLNHHTFRYRKKRLTEN